MKTANVYFTFNGNCREAMVFYQQCLGGVLRFQTMRGSPLPVPMETGVKDIILHSILNCNEFVLMGSDIVDENVFLKGNSVSLLLNFTCENEIRDCYLKLSRGAKQTYPLEITFWGTLFGSLVDKYGNTWMLAYPIKRN